MFQRLRCQFLIGAIALGAANMANAGLIDVASIEITPSSLNPQGWLHLAEVVAIETGTGNDLALTSAGASTEVSSSLPSTSPAFAIDGITDPVPPGEIFHSGENDGSSFLRIILAAASELSSIAIFGRTDCCDVRDIYDINLFDASGGLLFSVSGVDARDPSSMASVTLPNTAGPVPGPGPGPGPVPVPVPAPLSLLGIGLLGLLMARIRYAS